MEKLKVFKTDFHIHSVLSPCGSLEMSPGNIIKTAKENGLNLIALADHNAIENNYYLMKLSSKEGIYVWCGIEIQTLEEVHLLAIFDDYSKLKNFYTIIYPKLPPISNVPDYYGDQVVVDEKDEIVRFEEKLLLNSIQLSIDDIVELANKNGGIVIPSHITQKSYSLFSQLGYIPENLEFTALEIDYSTSVENVISEYPSVKNYPLVSFSDAHYLKDIGRSYTEFYLYKKPTVEEFKLAFLKAEGRGWKIKKRGN